MKYMETKICKLTNKFNKYCVSLIKNGELVAFPTETVYGLGANAMNGDVVKKIYEVKGRPQDNPLIVHIANKKDIEKYALIKNDIERRIIRKCMPGPISLILEKKDTISDVTTCGLKSVAIRFPSNKVAQKFIKATNLPICAPSANTSKRPSPTRAKDVFADMNGKIPAIIDGGQCTIGVESTVCKVDSGIIYILRPGKYSAKKLQKMIKVPVVDKLQNTSIVESPGTKYTHYAPKCEMLLVKNNIIKNINLLYTTLVDQGKKPIILCSKDNLKNFKNFNRVSIGKNSDEACKNIFKTLRDVENNYDVIIAEFIQSGNMADALFNRMIKSAGGKIV